MKIVIRSGAILFCMVACFYCFAAARDYKSILGRAVASGMISLALSCSWIYFYRSTFDKFAASIICIISLWLTLSSGARLVGL
jgi:hypothetical protein